MPSAADQAGSLPAGRTLDHAGVVALRWHHRPAFRAMGVTGGPSTVGHGEDFQGVAVGVVPVESPALVGARFVDSLSLVARVGVRRDAMVNSLAWRQVSGMSAAVSGAERSLSRCQGGPGLGAPCLPTWIPVQTVPGLLGLAPGHLYAVWSGGDVCRARGHLASMSGMRRTRPG